MTQASLEALGVAPGTLPIDQESEAILEAEVGHAASAICSSKAPAMPWKSRASRRAAVGCRNIEWVLSMVVAWAADVAVVGIDVGRRRRSPCRSIEAVLQDGFDAGPGMAPISRARPQAASSRSAPKVLARRRMPTQDRKPCSGCRREHRITSTRARALSPTRAASFRTRPWVQS